MSIMRFMLCVVAVGMMASGAEAGNKHREQGRSLSGSSASGGVCTGSMTRRETGLHTRSETAADDMEALTERDRIREQLRDLSCLEME